MKVTYAHLCDYAVAAADGKPTHAGLFSRLFVKGLPAAHLRSFFVFGVSIPEGEALRPKSYRVLVVAPSGKELGESKGTLTPKAIGKRGPILLSHSIVPIPVLGIEELGVHRVRLFLGSGTKAAAEALFEVAEKEESAAGR